jgi:hypothetical protein
LGAIAANASKRTGAPRSCFDTRYQLCLGRCNPGLRVLGTSVTDRKTARVGFSGASPYHSTPNLHVDLATLAQSQNNLSSTALDCASPGRLVARSFRPDRQPDTTTDEDRLPLPTPFLNFGLDCERTQSTTSTLNLLHCAFRFCEPYTVARDTYRFIVEFIDSSTGGVAASLSST